MSYGKVSKKTNLKVFIAADLRNDVPTKKIAEKINARFSDISMLRAKQIVKIIKEVGSIAEIDWSRKRIRKVRPYKNKYGETVY